jgi:hypothetical protein
LSFHVNLAKQDGRCAKHEKKDQPLLGNTTAKNPTQNNRNRKSGKN